ncbi:hypothetical protein NQZ68_002402 [Dissostichus eleginoides]|nr:hypothetical protein NQZ68_002402 [Dissostichus eleginoides]
MTPGSCAVLAVSWRGMRRLTQRKQLTAPGPCLVLAGPGGELLGALPDCHQQGFIGPRGLLRFHQGNGVGVFCIWNEATSWSIMVEVDFLVKTS